MATRPRRLRFAFISISDEAIDTEDDAKLRAYFAADYVFHGPGGDLSFDQLPVESTDGHGTRRLSQLSPSR